VLAVCGAIIGRRDVGHPYAFFAERRRGAAKLLLAVRVRNRRLLWPRAPNAAPSRRSGTPLAAPAFSSEPVSG
jgi:hypothetical protein